MVGLKDLQPLTGYLRGGVTVFGAAETSRFRGRDDRALRLHLRLCRRARSTGSALSRRLSSRYRGHTRRSQQRSASPVKRPYFLIHLAKDLRIEWRSKDALNSMLFFALLVVVLFSLAFDPTSVRFAADLRRHPVRGHPLRLGERAQSGLDP